MKRISGPRSSISAELEQLWRELASGQALKFERAERDHIRGRFELFPRYARLWDQAQAHISEAQFDSLSEPIPGYAMANEPPPKERSSRTNSDRSDPFADFVKRPHPDGPNKSEEDDLSWLKCVTVEELPEIEPPRIIDGLLRVGEKLGVTAGSKKFKTWLLLYLGYCIANGLPFLGFATKASRVVIFDLELSAWGLGKRLKKIQKAVGAGTFENFRVYALRGKARKFCGNLEAVKAQIAQEGFEVVIIDPVYKFLLGKDESSNGIVAAVLEQLTEFCMEVGVAIIYVHHHSKGNQAGKDSLDRSSGAGAGAAILTQYWIWSITINGPRRNRFLLPRLPFASSKQFRNSSSAGYFRCWSAMKRGSIRTTSNNHRPKMVDGLRARSLTLFSR